MSRTHKKEKGPGYDYWYPEANSDGKWCTKPGRFSKRIISKRNRRNIKTRLKNGYQEERDFN